MLEYKNLSKSLLQEGLDVDAMRARAGIVRQWNEAGGEPSRNPYLQQESEAVSDPLMESLSLEEAAQGGKAQAAIAKRLKKSRQMKKVVEEAQANNGRVQASALKDLILVGVKIGFYLGAALGALVALPLLLAGPVGLVGVAVSAVFSGINTAVLGALIALVVYALRKEPALRESYEGLEEASGGSIYVGKTEDEIANNVARAVVRAAFALKSVDKEALKAASKDPSKAKAIISKASSKL